MQILMHYKSQSKEWETYSMQQPLPNAYDTLTDKTNRNIKGKH